MWEILIDFASKNVLVSIVMLVSCIALCVLFASMFFCIHDISEKYCGDAEIKECANKIVFYDDVILAYGADDYKLCVETILKKRAAREIKEKLQ